MWNQTSGGETLLQRGSLGCNVPPKWHLLNAELCRVNNGHDFVEYAFIQVDGNICCKALLHLLFCREAFCLMLCYVHYRWIVEVT